MLVILKELLLYIVVEVIGGVIVYFICKWLDRE